MHTIQNVGNIPFSVTSLAEARDWLISRAYGGGDGISVRLSNAWCVALASDDRSYAALFEQEALNLPDGAPVGFALRAIFRRRSAGRVRGPSLFAEVLDKGREKRIRHYFLGSTPQTIELMAAEIQKRYPDLIIAGYSAPPFGPVDGKFIETELKLIRESEAQMVWVGMGTPKQDFVTTIMAKGYDAPFLGVGAAFDFAAGTVPEAPLPIQRLGFEWAYRFAKEPKRLWKRYLYGNARFMQIILFQKLAGGRSAKIR